MQFLVHQKKYRNKHNQCIIKSGMPHASEAIEDYCTKILS